MKKIFLSVTVFIFSFLCVPAGVFAQNSVDNYLHLDESQLAKSKELRDEYKEQKEELEIQLKKLQKDREVAVRDGNSSLVERRTREIKQTRARISGLAKEYGEKYSDMLTEEQKAELKADSDFYAGELAAQRAKADESELPTPKKAAGKKKPAAKKKAAAKK